MKLLFLFLILSACSGKVSQSQQLLNKIEHSTEKNHKIEHGHLLAIYALNNSSIKTKSIYAKDYGRIINEEKYNDLFLASLRTKYKNFSKLNASAKIKIAKIKDFIIKLNNRYHFLPAKYEHIFNLSKGRSHNVFDSLFFPTESNDSLKTLDHLDKIITHLPIMLPENAHKIKVTSLYGKRRLKKGKSKFHCGLDLQGNKSAIIYASANGVVDSVKRMNGYGNTIDIRHENQFKTRYAHLSKIYVKEGDKVIRGSKIGIQGNTGNSTGEHLHFEIWYQNKHLNPYDFIVHGLP